MGLGLKKFLKTVAKHGKEHTKVLFNPKKMHEHLKNPLKDHFRQYQEFTETTVGKIVFTAVSFYVGGILANAFSGAGAAGGAAGETTGTVANTSTAATTSSNLSQAASAAATNIGSGAGSVAGGSVSAGASGVGSTVSGVSQIGGSAVGGSSGLIGSTGAAGSAAGGFWAGAAKTAKGIGAWAKDNPAIVASIAQGVSSMATPDELDYMNEQEKIRQENLQRQNKNLEEVSNINLRLSSSKKPLRRLSGEPVYNNEGGLIRRRLNTAYENQ